LITTAANDLMSSVHDRMPVLIPRDRWDDWLNPNYDNIDALSDIFTSTNDSILKMHAVSAKVNDVRNNAADLLAEI
jgi:putative SOS response-associated peptidase YedK